MAYDGPGPAWEPYESRHGRRPEPEPGKGRRRLRAILAAGGAAALVAVGVVVSSHHDNPPPARASVISEQGYAGLLSALRSGPGTEVTSVYLDADFAQVHMVKDAARDEMWLYSPDGGLRIQSTSRAVDAGRSFDATAFDGARLADACAATAQDVESTPEHCTVIIAPVDRLAHPAWVEVVFGAYRGYYDRAMRPTYPAGS